MGLQTKRTRRWNSEPEKQGDEILNPKKKGMDIRTPKERKLSLQTTGVPDIDPCNMRINLGIQRTRNRNSESQENVEFNTLAKIFFMGI